MNQNDLRQHASELRDAASSPHRDVMAKHLRRGAALLEQLADHLTSQPEIHVGLRGLFTDDDLQQAGQDWGDPTGEPTHG